MAEKKCNEKIPTHEQNETHNLMSVLFMVCASNNFQIIHQLSFECTFNKKNKFSYDDIHRHSKIYYGICLYSANVNWVLVFFPFFFFFLFLLLLCLFVFRLYNSCCVSFWPTQITFVYVHYLIRSFSVACCRWYVQYGDGIHIFICISMYRFITHRKYTVAMKGPLPMISLGHTNNCTLICHNFFFRRIQQFL